jgi:DNA-binding XRE family transcriptional regulator
MVEEVDNTEVIGETREDEDALERDLLPQNIVDRVAFGRRLRARRVLEGYDRVGQLTHILRSRYGVDVSDRTIYAIERGEQMPHLDFVLAVVAALKTPLHYFAPVIRSDVWQALVTEEA